MVGEQDKTTTRKRIGHGRAEATEIRQRKEFILSCLARGLYDEETITTCLTSSLFRLRSGKMMKRSSIRQYVYLSRAERRARPLHGSEMIRDTIDRLLCTYRAAFAAKQYGAATQTQRTLIRMLGLRTNLAELPDEMDVRRQTEAMDWSIAPPKWEEENGDDNDNDNDGDKA
jgi:hypothetical protein